MKPLNYYTPPVLLLAFCSASFAEISQVRIINETNAPVFIHKGGYAAASRILPKKWAVYKYPFLVKVPGQAGKEISTGLLIATAGGQWTTTSNGYTYLKNPNLVQCIDYSSEANRKKTGHRIWVIKGHSIDHFCYRNKLKGYKQPWYIPNQVEN